MSFLWAFTDRFALAKRFTIKNVPAGAAVRLSCTPPKGRRLPVGTRIEVRVTHPELIGRVFRFTVRNGRVPSVRTLCHPPGSKNPRKC